MASLWEMGEHSGREGTELDLNAITCPFCLEVGNFEVEHHAEKKKPNSEKRLNFDTLVCTHCQGYVLVLWSAGRDLHSARVLPTPRRLDRHPDHWPPDVGRYWLQAKRNLADENWDAAALMARSALQLALRQQGAKGKTLKQEIDDLAGQGKLPPVMKEWSDELRELGNDSAHPRPGQAATSSEDATGVVNFLDFLLRYLYTLPHEIAQHRQRKKG